MPHWHTVGVQQEKKIQIKPDCLITGLENSFKEIQNEKKKSILSVSLMCRFVAVLFSSSFFERPNFLFSKPLWCCGGGVQQHAEFFYTVWLSLRS